MKIRKCTMLNALVLLLGAPSLTAKDRITVNPDAVNNQVILHTWSWNFKNIAKSMQRIAEAGFDIIQTSPVQTCFAPEGSGKMIFDDDVTQGNWYYYYQPTDWKIGNYIVGSKTEMVEMMDSAKKYNVKVIVDVLPNHTAFDVDAVSDDLVNAAGGRDKLYHSKGLDLIDDYSNREKCTLWAMGALPDVNTENPKFQKYYMQFVNELLGMGVRGFRYDTAKHIGVPSDPVDSKSGVKENDFWDVATGRKSVGGIQLALPYDSLFVYGEILQGDGVPEREYSEYMNQTASDYGHVLRTMLEKRTAKGLDILSFHHQSAPEFLTTWVESHDTYANAHESAHLTDEQIRLGWVFLTARQNGTPLFFSRPAGSDRKHYWGDNILGAAGNDEYFHPEVAAANKFRKVVGNAKENIQMNENGDVLLVSRGKKGAAIVNIGTHPNSLDLPTTLSNGTYYDKVYNKEFKVKNGRLTGILGPERSYILTK